MTGEPTDFSTSIRVRVHALLALMLVLGLTACGARPAETNHDRDEHAAEEANDASHEKSDGRTDSHTGAEDGEHLSLEGVRGVTFGEVSPPVEEGVWYPAEAMASEQERAMITSPIAGQVAAITTSPGREVAAGTPLVTLRSAELAELTAALLKSRVTREQAATEYAREERLAKAAAGAPRELAAARAALAVAEAEEGAARLALEARGIAPDQAGATLDVRAPYRGRLASIDVAIGEGVSSGQKLGIFETARASLVRVELPLPGPASWAQGVPTTVRRSDGKGWAAHVDGLPASLTAETRRLVYRLRLDDDELPYPGTPLEARVPLATGIVVPQDAVQQIEGEWGVFLVDGERARFLPIRRGPDLGGDVIVLEGLVPGQRIAIEGAYLLKALALKRSGGGEEHAH
jgi:cobalt-zinc-cadmium efflux system membrane fusion protein